MHGSKKQKAADHSDEAGQASQDTHGHTEAQSNETQVARHDQRKRDAEAQEQGEAEEESGVLGLLATWAFGALGIPEDGEAPGDAEAAFAHIPNQDIIYEQLAHHGAYSEDGIPAQTLADWGYTSLDPLEVKESGLRAVAYVPIVQPGDPGYDQVVDMHGKALRPVIAFRGSAVGLDFADDLNPEGIGTYQFYRSEKEINEYVGMAKGGADGVDVTGHSLGGAHAQMCAVLVSGVRRCVTFQSPGINLDLAAQGDCSGVEATHHRRSGDIVPLGGESMLPGEVNTFTGEMDNKKDTILENSPLSHLDFSLTGVNAARGGEIPHIFGSGAYANGAPSADQPSERMNEISSIETRATDLSWTDSIKDVVRQGIGIGAQGVAEAADMLDGSDQRSTVSQMDDYVRVTREAKLMQAEGRPRTEITRLVLDSGLDEEHQVEVLKNMWAASSREDSP